MNASRRSLIWLGIGAMLMLFANGRWIIPIATWFYPVFLLRFLRLQKPFRGVIILALINGGISAISWWKMVPVPIGIYFVISFLFSNIMILAFLADRLLATKMNGFFSTLIFPLAWCSLEFLCTFSPKASWNVLAYTQDQPVLLQLASLTGIWGISFVITWFASIINWIWVEQFEWPKIKSGVVAFAGVVAIIVLYGVIRLNIGSSEQKYVRTASIVASRNINKNLSTCKWSDAKAIGVYSDDVENNLLEKTVEAARSGAKMILWQESAGFIPMTEEKTFIERASALASSEKIYLLMTLWSVPEDFPKHLIENKMIVIDTNGNRQLVYVKTHAAPPEPIIRGDGQIPTLQTSYGKIAPAICFDAEFPNFIRQAGKNNVDIMFLPANDWKEIDPIHSHMAVMRAIENGFSLVHPAGQGLSVAADNRGRIIASMDFYTSDQQVMYADVPYRHSNTLYAKIGDAFGWMCIAGFLVVLMSVVVKSKLSQRYPDDQAESFDVGVSTHQLAVKTGK